MRDLRFLALVCFCLSAPLLIVFRSYVPGGAAWLLSVGCVVLARDGAFQRRMGTLLACIAILTVAPINTNTSTSHFIALGIPFFLVIAVPALLLQRTDPGVIRFRIWPRRFRFVDVFYVLVSIPLSWLAFHFYFGAWSPEVPSHWPLPALPDREATWRLFIGINCVGIWDELFFINTVYAVLRSLFAYPLANAAQAVIYTTVLYHMAFTGAGPFIVYLFALTQGAMFKESDSLLYVLVVHLIVDAFLFAAILHHYYPGAPLLPF
jgi:CAAX prenyl protease-like protein